MSEVLEAEGTARSRGGGSLVALGVLLVAGVALHAGWPAQSFDGPYTLWDGDVRELALLLAWLLAATTEPNFYTSALAGIGLLGGGCVAHWLSLRGARGQGLRMACGSGLWPATVTSALLGLLLSNLLWGWTVAESGVWQPTFAPFVSVPPAVVLVFGASGRSVLSGAVLGALLVTPCSLLLVELVCRPLGLPPVVGATGGMAVGALLAFGVCRRVPFLVPVARPTGPVAPPPRGRGWLGRRLLADFSEAQFFGNEWASAGLILGVLAAYALSPGLPYYGSGLLPQLLLAQAITGVAAVAVWRRRWARRAFYPTFVPIVSVAPAAVLAYGGSFPELLVGSLLGAVLGPFLAAAIAQRLPHDFHPFIGNVASMAISTALIVPAFDLLPTAATV